jgi:hypothetical protein
MRYSEKFKMAAVVAAMIITAYIGFFPVGCATIQPGQDTTVVRTQQTLAIGQYVYDHGMTWCKANAVNLSPAGLQLVNKVRVEFPLAYRTLDTALDLYKAGKAGDLQAALARFTELVGLIEGLVSSFGGPDLGIEARANVGGVQ